MQQRRHPTSTTMRQPAQQSLVLTVPLRRPTAEAGPLRTGLSGLKHRCESRYRVELHNKNGPSSRIVVVGEKRRSSHFGSKVKECPPFLPNDGADRHNTTPYCRSKEFGVAGRHHSLRKCPGDVMASQSGAHPECRSVARSTFSHVEEHTLTIKELNLIPSQFHPILVWHHIHALLSLRVQILHTGAAYTLVWSFSIHRPPRNLE
ncbi:hypothetical protein EDD37DRAFT_491441 [Exophiala viscosa]|uniref:uncharacterized protein n=1 Tax=Exophiala viscosa TaxID=2486360 RepID=UPI0021A009F3|nr:hypothetical protein EDD37DRAFT_491441 [Exophiala viscosa]